MNSIEIIRDLLSDPYSSSLEQELKVDQILQDGITIRLVSHSCASARKGSLLNLFFYLYHNTHKTEFANYKFLYHSLKEDSKWKVEWLNHKKQSQQVQEVEVSPYNIRMYGNGSQNAGGHVSYFKLTKLNKLVGNKNMHDEVKKIQDRIKHKMWQVARDILIEELTSGYLWNQVRVPYEQACDNYFTFLGNLGIKFSETKPKKANEAYSKMLNQTIKTSSLNWGLYDLVEWQGVMSAMAEDRFFPNVLNGKTNPKHLWTDMNGYKTNVLDQWHEMVMHLQEFKNEK